MTLSYLVADVGGTNTRVACTRGATIDAASVRRFSNSDYGSLEAVLSTFCDDLARPGFAAAAVAVAGPVTDGVARLTNLDWSIDADRLCHATGAGYGQVLNDLVAQGYGLGRHAPGSATRLIEGTHQPCVGDSQLVIGIGTGFNAAPVHETPHGRHVVASECGHITLPAISETDFELSRDLRESHVFPGIEDVLSGRGMQRLYRIASGRVDAGSAEIRHALAEGTPAAEAAAARFLRVMGMVVGDLALIHLPYGGIHLIGGMARAVAPRLVDPRLSLPFREGFFAKGRFSTFLESFSISLVGDDFAALSGIAAHLENRLPR